MSGDDEDDAVPTHITRTKAPTEYSVDLADVGDDDDDEFANADTDTMTLSGPGGELLAPSKSSPMAVSFRLLKIASTFAPCLFCGEVACDMTFVAKSHVPTKTKAYAVHSECVFDHEELQALGSGGL